MELRRIILFLTIVHAHTALTRTEIRALLSFPASTYLKSQLKDLTDQQFLSRSYRTKVPPCFEYQVTEKAMRNVGEALRLLKPLITRFFETVKSPSSSHHSHNDQYSAQDIMEFQNHLDLCLIDRFYPGVDKLTPRQHQQLCHSREEILQIVRRDLGIDL